MRLRSSLTGNPWTLAVLVASAGQRGGTLVSTLYFVHVVGVERFADVVPVLPVASLVGAVAVMGQDQAVLRRLLGAKASRLSIKESLRAAFLVWVVALSLGAPLALAVAEGFSLTFFTPLWAVGGGALFASAQATSVAQIRAARSSTSYIICFTGFGIVAVGARVALVEAGIDAAAAWALGDLAAGSAIALLGLLISPPSGGGANYELRGALQYGIPFLPHAGAQQVLGNADRWILAGRVAPRDLAMYVTAYQVANVVNILLSEVNRSRQHRYVGVTPGEHGALNKSERKLLLKIVAGCAVPVAAISAGAVGQDIVFAFVLSLGICASFIAVALYLPLANVWGLSLGRTTALARASGAGALTNVAVNFAFVRPLGVWAAVVATFVGYLAMFSVLHVQRGRL